MLTYDVRPTLRSAVYGSVAVALGAACLSGLTLSTAQADTVVDPGIEPASLAQEPEVVVETEEIPDVGVGGADEVSPQAEVEPHVHEEDEDHSHEHEDEHGHEHHEEPFERDGFVLASELEETDTGEFSLLGVTWETSAEIPLVVEVRTKTDGAWTDWVDVHVEPDAGEGGRAGTEPFWVGPSTGVAVRVFTEDGESPGDLELMTVDPDETAADAAIGTADQGSTATALYAPNATADSAFDDGGLLTDGGEFIAASTAPRPNFIMRTTWGPTARETSCAASSGPLEGIMVHHTAGNNTYTQAQAAGVVRGIHTFHVQGRGWCDIGYNSLVDRFGNVYEGRRGGLNNMVRGAHAGVTVFNQRYWSISVMGNFESANVPAAAQTALVNTAAWKLSLHNRPATGQITLGGVRVHRINGHRDVRSTACPGARLYSFVTGAMRTRTAQRIGQGGSNTHPQIDALYQQTGGASGPLGQATSSVGTGSAGLAYRRYANGSIYHRGNRTVYLTNPVDQTFRGLRGTAGPLGMPTTSVSTNAGGMTFARFESGSIYSTSAGTHALTGAIDTRYRALGGTTSTLGLPTTPITRAGSGTYFARFQNGSIYRNGNDAHALSGVIDTSYRAHRGTSGPLGVPTSSVLPANSGTYYARLTNGSIYRNGNAAYALTNPIDQRYRSTTGTSGALGLPTTDALTNSNGLQYARFNNGSVYSPNRGSALSTTYAVWGAVDTRYRSEGGSVGSLGMPRSSNYSPESNIQHADFAGGTIRWNQGNGNTHIIRGGSVDSSTFIIPSSGQIPIQGRGFGHGLGMSQNGAQGAAVSGRTYQQILSHYYPGTTLTTRSTRIRVLISAQSSSALTVQAASGLQFRDLNAAAPRNLPTTMNGSTVSQWRILPLSSNRARSALQYRTGSSWHTFGEFSGTGQFHRANREHPIGLVLPSGTVVQYRDTLRHAKPTATTRATVNEVWIDKYTQGVVSREMPSSWHAQAQRAQAVAARTYGVQSIRSGGYYDICDTTSCQVYGGYTAETANGNAAVVATQHRILTYNGQPALTQYSASNGGRTANGSLPYQVAKDDPYDSWSGNPRHTWTITVTRSRLQSAYPSVGTPQRIELLNRTSGGAWGGRVGNVRITGTNGSVTVTGDQFRFALGLHSRWIGF